MRYRLHTPTIAVVRENSRSVALMIPRGDIVEISREVPDDAATVEVQWENKECQMFTVDLRERGEEVGTTGGKGSAFRVAKTRHSPSTGNFRCKCGEHLAFAGPRTLLKNQKREKDLRIGTCPVCGEVHEVPLSKP